MVKDYTFPFLFWDSSLRYMFFCVFFSIMKLVDNVHWLLWAMDLDLIAVVNGLNSIKTLSLNLQVKI